MDKLKINFKSIYMGGKRIEEVEMENRFFWMRFIWFGFGIIRYINNINKLNRKKVLKIENE